MKNDLATFDQSQQNNQDQPEFHKTSHTKNLFDTGAIVFKKDTGMAFKICKKSHANGIEHLNLLCVETGSSVYLSKFALEKNYTHDDSQFERFGLRMVRRLSDLLTK